MLTPLTNYPDAPHNKKRAHIYLHACDIHVLLFRCIVGLGNRDVELLIWRRELPQRFVALLLQAEPSRQHAPFQTNPHTNTQITWLMLTSESETGQTCTLNRMHMHTCK